jgi:hypothetical protein
MKIDLEKSGFTLCTAKPHQEPYRDAGGIWKLPDGTPEHHGFESLRKLYAPEAQPVESSEIPFVILKK